MPTFNTIAVRPEVKPGDIVALNPRECGYFDDKTGSGIYLHQFALPKGSNKAKLSSGRDLSNVQRAVELGRLVVLRTMQDSPPPAYGRNIKLSDTTRARISEMNPASAVSPKALMNNHSKKLLVEIIPNINDKATLECMLQLEVNGDNPTERPRIEIVEALKAKIKTYAKQVSVVNLSSGSIVSDEIVEKEGEKDLELFENKTGFRKNPKRG